MLNITFRTVELSAREMQIAVNLDRNGYDPLSQIEFICLRADPNTPNLSDLAKSLWLLPASEVSATYDAAFDAGIGPTLASMKKLQEQAQRVAAELSDRALKTQTDGDSIFDEAADEGLSM